jgi:hypothetical protein
MEGLVPRSEKCHLVYWILAQSRCMHMPNRVRIVPLLVGCLFGWPDLLVFKCLWQCFITPLGFSVTPHVRQLVVTTDPSAPRSSHQLVNRESKYVYHALIHNDELIIIQTVHGLHMRMLTCIHMRTKHCRPSGRRQRQLFCTFAF